MRKKHCAVFRSIGRSVVRAEEKGLATARYFRLENIPSKRAGGEHTGQTAVRATLRQLSNGTEAVEK